MKSQVRSSKRGRSEESRKGDEKKSEVKLELPKISDNSHDIKKDRKTLI